jgi:hypothetical protein
MDLSRRFHPRVGPQPTRLSPFEKFPDMKFIKSFLLHYLTIAFFSVMYVLKIVITVAWRAYSKILLSNKRKDTLTDDIRSMSK